MMLWLLLTAHASDCDLDALDDASELGCAAGSTDPDLADSDGGGESDGVERARGSDPCDPDDDLPMGDRDGDTLPDRLERLLGTNPRRADTDGDRTPDELELRGLDGVACTGDETHPLRPDTDGDGIRDGEDLYPTDPLAPGMSPEPIAPDACVQVLRRGRDPEFDAVSGQVTWQSLDRRGRYHLVVAQVDPTTGDLVDAEAWDTDLLPVSRASNGPEWMVDPDGSRILYSKEDDRGVTQLWVAEPDGDGGWLPEPVDGTLGGIGPFGTQDPDDPDDRFIRWSEPDPDLFRLSWVRAWDDPDSAYVFGEALTAHRFASGWPAITLTAFDLESGLDQVFFHVPQTEPPEVAARTRVTTGPPDKEGAFSWVDPVLGPLVLTTHHAASGDPTAMAVYRVDDGSLVTLIPSPGALPFVVSPEPFVWDGRSYVSWEASRGPLVAGREEWGHHLGSRDGDAAVWIASIDAGHGGRTSFARRLTAAGLDDVQLDLKDPEAYTGGDRAWVYYTVDLPGDLQVWRCETGL